MMDIVREEQGEGVGEVVLRRMLEAKSYIMKSFIIFHSSHNIMRLIKSRMMRLVGHIRHIGEVISTYKILVIKPWEESIFETQA
jgi:hypothetical protein